MPSRISDDFPATAAAHHRHPPAAVDGLPQTRRPARDANQIREYPVRFTDLDLFDHMNNAVYWSVIEDYLSTHPRAAQSAAEGDHRT